MKIFITGGTGFVGSHLAKKLVEAGHKVTVLTRKIRSGRILPSGASYCQGDPNVPGSWQETLADHDMAINLAGASIIGRWTESKKDEIRNSRINTTHHLVDGIEMAAAKGRQIALLSTSAVGYYGDRGDELLTEQSSPGTDFLGHLAQDWEREALRAEEYGARVVRCRFGLVLGATGGVLGKMLPAFRLGLGSRLGSGRQWFSWIHQGELASIFAFLVDKPALSGPFNCVAPESVTNDEFTRQLAQALDRRVLPIGIPALVLKLAFGEMSTVLLGGQRVSPENLREAGYVFRFPTVSEALTDLLKQQ
ncbi:MAG: TIGR01777 family oxidoreductase [Deltaproteobacteria bacterium]|nr:TIGR01777 family oxidoreductase [Candidatus Anaeroferrophillus wilburensis]MBN2887980.1 TIGR01777 family oxidoreductase [Deltaproteobacteria bacterium]